MAENSAISRTTHTWMSCTKLSPSCDGCYAEAADGQGLHKVPWGNRARQRTGAHTWNDPLRTKTATPRRAGGAPNQRNSGVGADAPRSAKPYVVRTFPTSCTCPGSSR
ncbi:hypothetical protein E5176_33435 [Ensifer adhaerens]|nr:hypothetical protein E5176_33435 [Ensifer adhaerens]